MNIHFLGTGEATDPSRRNTTILIEMGDRHHLLDCGFSSAQAYLRRSTAACLETIWVSIFMVITFSVFHNSSSTFMSRKENCRSETCRHSATS